MNRVEAEKVLKAIWGEGFDPESASWKNAENFEQDGNVLRYTVSADSVTGYIKEVDLKTGESRTCGTGEGCFWTDWR